MASLLVQFASMGAPAMANHYTREAHRKAAYARMEHHRYQHAAYEARKSRSKGHGLMARLHSHHAAHLYKRSMEHAAEARADRYVARHRF